VAVPEFNPSAREEIEAVQEGAGVGLCAAAQAAGPNGVRGSDPQLYCLRSPLSDWPPVSDWYTTSFAPNGQAHEFILHAVGAHGAKPIHLKSKNDSWVDPSTMT
jgi:hypothetical protein